MMEKMDNGMIGGCPHVLGLTSTDESAQAVGTYDDRTLHFNN